MKIQKKKISGKAVLLDCFSTPCECTEFLTIYLSNLSNKTTLENCQNTINTNSNTQQGGFVEWQQRLLSQLPGLPGWDWLHEQGTGLGPLLCPCTPRGDSSSLAHGLAVPLLQPELDSLPQSVLKAGMGCNGSAPPSALFCRTSSLHMKAIPKEMSWNLVWEQLSPWERQPGRGAGVHLAGLPFLFQNSSLQVGMLSRIPLGSFIPIQTGCFQKTIAANFLLCEYGGSCKRNRKFRGDWAVSQRKMRYC